MINSIEEVEKALVGSLLMYPKNIQSVVSVVKERDFINEQSRRLFLLIVSLWVNKKTVDCVNILSEDPTMALYINDVIDKSSPIGLRDYAATICCKAKGRRIDSSLEKISKDNIPPTDKLSAILKLYQSEISENAKDSTINAVISRFEKNVNAVRKRGSFGIPTGFDFLDEIYVQYVPGHIWTIGAYTSVGKTAVMIQKMVNLINSNENPSVIVVSTEMTEDQLMARLISNFTGIHAQRILSAKYYQGEEEVVEEYKNLIRGKNFRIYDNTYSLDEIETVFRKVDLQGGVDIGFIDYVQNCTTPDVKDDYQKGSVMAKRLQKLAKDVKATIICLSQVSNDVGRGNTNQFELKGAGEWAAVSDVGIMLTRNQKDKGKIQYSIKKNRHGKLLEYGMEYKMDFTRIEAIGPITS